MVWMQREILREMNLCGGSWLMVHGLDEGGDFARNEFVWWFMVDGSWFGCRGRFCEKGLAIGDFNCSTLQR